MSEESDDSEACAERDHSKKKWRVELSDEQLDMLMRCSDFKEKVQKRLRRKSAVKRLQRSGEKLRRGSRVSRSRALSSSSSSSDSDSSDGQRKRETLPLSKPNNNQEKEKDVLGDIDELLKEDGEETTPVVSTPDEDWKDRARVLDERSIKRVSRRFSAELEELNGNKIDSLTNNMSNGTVLRQTRVPMMRRSRKELPSEMPGVHNVSITRNLQGHSDKGSHLQISGPRIPVEARKSNKASDPSNIRPILSTFIFIYSYLKCCMTMALLNTFMSGGMPRVSWVSVPQFPIQFRLM